MMPESSLSSADRVEAIQQAAGGREAQASPEAQLQPRRKDRTGRTGKDWLGLVLVFWVGFNLRAVLLAFPPILEGVRISLHMSYSEAGLVSSIPLLLFGLGALPGAWLCRRIGAHGVVAIGLALIAAGSAARALPGGITPLFVGTILFAAGIAIAQPGLPSMVQAWFPGNVQQASTIGALGLMGGEMISASVTAPFIAPLVGGWRGTFLVWALPAAICLAFWWVARDGRGDPGPVQQTASQKQPVTQDSSHAGHSQPQGSRAYTASSDATDTSATRRAAMHRPVLPLLRSPLVLWLMALFSGQSFVYYAANSWLPASAHGGIPGASLDLFALNGIAVPITITLVLTRRHFVRSRTFYVMGCLATALGVVGWLLLPYLWAEPVAALLMGTGIASTFTGLLAYPPSVAEPDDVAPLSALIWTVAYAASFTGPLLSGAIIQLTHNTRAAFFPIAVAAAIMVIASLAIPHKADLPKLRQA